MTLVSDGTFNNQGNEMTWVDSSYCNGTYEPATYTWTHQNGILILNVKGNDICVDRNRTLEGIPYHG